MFKIEEAFNTYYKNNPMPSEEEGWEYQNEQHEESEEMEKKEIEIQYIEFYRRLSTLALPYIQPDGTLRKITEPFMQRSELSTATKTNE
jgi:hypothetical protein